jgi:hypothetical protein
MQELLKRAAANRADVLAEDPGAISALDQWEQGIRDDLAEARIPVTPSTVVAMIAGAEAVAAQLIDRGDLDACESADDVIVTLAGMLG